MAGDGYSNLFKQVDIYPIGTISSGTYVDKTLALALYTDQWNPKQHSTQTYVYFISDAVGNPVAWDSNFVHEYAGSNVRLSQQIGLVASQEAPLSFLPQEFNYAQQTTKQFITSGSARFSDNWNGELQELDSTGSPQANGQVQSVGKTDAGWPIVKVTIPNAPSVTGSPNYFLALPYGVYQEIAPEPDFVPESGVPSVAWATGDASTTRKYNYGQYAYGVDDCYTDLTKSGLESALVQTGKTSKGDSVYEINQKYDTVYRCLYEKTKRYNYNTDTKVSTAYYPTTYDAFLLSHPLFFWHHPYGALLMFVREDVVPPAEKAKPVVYLYPKKTEQVSVKVEPIGGFTKTDPAYGSGWNVTATPDSVLTNLTDGKTYPYLFWEGGAKGVVNTPKEGFVVAQADIPALLIEKLALLGLDAKERDDFMSFWVPHLSKAPYYFITFVPKSEMDRVAPLTIVPTPDSVIRVLMDYQPLSASISVNPLDITTPARIGFTVVEWGGIVRD